MNIFTNIYVHFAVINSVALGRGFLFNMKLVHVYLGPYSVPYSVHAGSLPKMLHLGAPRGCDIKGCGELVKCEPVGGEGFHEFVYFIKTEGWSCMGVLNHTFWLCSFLLLLIVKTI
jgi:hypothetical protein